ncbi:MAG: hypothetical protein V2A77_01350 [Pseudomonadota bacterium]
MIVSFHPRLAADANFRLPGSQVLSAATRQSLGQAQAVLLPVSVTAPLYRACLGLCPTVFPNYQWRFGWEGKSGASVLFEHLGLPHPRTLRYHSVAEFRCQFLEGGEPLSYPFVLKGDRGGGGNWVFLIRHLADLALPLARIEQAGWPLVAQEYVDHGGRDARVVVMGDRLHGYWRRQTVAGEFRNNICRGAFIDHDSEPLLLRAAEEAVRAVCRRTGLDLAAFDIFFGPEETPLFCEINYFFGHKGLTVAGRYYHLLAGAAQEWLARRGVEGRIRPLMPD